MTDQPTSPSPKPKEPGSNKRIMTTQPTPNRRPQPPLTLEASGQDGIGHHNPNPNHNPQIYHQLPFILSHSRDTLLTNLDWIASPDIPIITLSPHTLTDIPLMTPLIHPHLYY